MTHFSIKIDPITHEYFVGYANASIYQTVKPLPDIKMSLFGISVSIYDVSTMLARLIRAELFMQKLPKAEIKHMATFDFLHNKTAVRTLDYIKDTMPPDFQPMYDSFVRYLIKETD